MNSADRRIPSTDTGPLAAIRSTLATALLVAYCLTSPTWTFAEDAVSGYTESELSEADFEHWSFRPVERVAIPDAPADVVSRNEIDHFIAATLRESDLRLQPEASRRTLVRRLHLDLHGLPPEPAVISEFLRQDSEQAYDALVDQLLDSPRYGERWAQFWLDLARFADTDGFEFDKERPEAWTYRDWVIQALNSDMSYDEFLRQQIAGDELYPDNPAALTATRFCLSGPDMPDINLMEERRHTLLNEIVATVSESVLGLQVGCAQCHDHKYDPISQGDFYRMRAAFEPAVQLKKNHSLTVFQEEFPYGRSARVMLRGDFRRPGPEVSPGVIRVLASDQQPFTPQPSSHSAGLRTALAKWLVDVRNPLTARVIVNRIWQHHFGRGIVASASEFGVIGDAPSHEELLDYLSAWLVDHDWSLKALHRLILTSATWRQRSFLPPDVSPDERVQWQAALEADPDAVLLSRYPRWRLEGEAVRDCMLQAAGQLNLKTGGPGVRPPLPKELLETLLKNQWNVTEDTAEHDRRSIYIFARRNLRYPIFEVFDRPMANASCPQRHVSTTAPQSLHLLNSAFSLNTARRMSEQIAEITTDRTEQIRMVFERTLGRLPTSAEHDEIRRFLDRQDPQSTDDALTHLCLSIFNCSEFIFVD